MAIKQAFINQNNSVFGASNKKRIAQKMLQGSVDVGMAVVNILNATGIAGFRFHVPQTEMIRLENDVTDHYIETNTAVQDHIAQRPILITLEGLVGDYFYSNHKIMDMVSVVTSNIGLIRAYMPNISERIQNAKIAKSRSTYGATDKLTPKEFVGAVVADDLNDIDIFALMQGLYKFTSAQTRAFLFFEALWKARKMFTVETTWRRYDNMVIQSMQARRDNNADITEFSVTFKQLSFTQTLTETVEEYANRMEQQRAKVTNKGLAQGTLMSIDDVAIG